MGEFIRGGSKNLMYGKVKSSLLERVDQSTLRWFDQMERIDEGMLTKRIYRTGVNGVRKRGKLRKR